MNAERLLQHYEQIADAPDAVPRLRRFILDLAMRGKLVSQDPADEPTSELLKRIATEKARLVQAGELRETREFHLASGVERNAPRGWSIVPLGQILKRHLGGGTPSKNENRYWGGDIPWASVKDVGKTKYIDGTVDRITDEGLASSSSNLIPPGNLIVVTRMGLGQLSINRVPVAINQDLRALFLSSFLNIDFAYNFFLTHQIDGTGLTVKGIKLDELLAIPFPLPPLAEQHRIVAKVDELMALCDALEAARTERETKRDRLAAASLARLNAPAPETFRNDARFALDALPALTARPDQIKQLRQTILNLAACGKLVPQDPADEPAVELLKRVQLRKPRSRKPTPRIDSRDAPYDVPTTWIWASLEQLVIYGPQNGISPRPTTREDAPKAITLTATTSGKFNPAYYKRVEGKFPPESDFWLSEGDLLFQRGNTPEYVGMAAIYEGPPHTFLFPDLIIKVRVSDDVDLSYVHLASISPSGRRYLTENASGAQATMPKINQTTLLSLPIPLPPLAEQHRIVARVDELMALCDQLEKSLTSADDTRKRLLDALLAEALAPVDAEALQEAAE